MITVHTHKKLKWIDAVSPTAEEVRSLVDEYSIDPLIGEEMLVPSLKPKVELFPNYLYLILHFPAVRHSHGKDHNQEVDFILGKNFLITARYDAIDPIHKFSKVFDVNSMINKDSLGEHAGFIFYHLVKKLYRSLTHELDYIADKLKVIERRIFSGNEKHMVFELSKVSRELLQFKQALTLHHEVLVSFEHASTKIFGPEFDYYAKGILSAFYRVQGEVSSNIDTLNELRATNDSLLNTKQNEIIKVLAVISFIMLPLSLMAGIFGMNTTENMPFINDPHGFFKILSVMAVSAVVSITYFKWKRWI